MSAILSLLAHLNRVFRVLKQYIIIIIIRVITAEILIIMIMIVNIKYSFLYKQSVTICEGCLCDYSQLNPIEVYAVNPFLYLLHKHTF